MKNSVVKLHLIILFFIEIFGAALPAYGGEKAATPLEKTGKLTSYCEMKAFLKKLAQSSENITMEELGKSGKYNTPIYLITVENKKIPEDRKLKVMVIARIHGSEPSGMEAAMGFIRDLADPANKQGQVYLENFNFYIIPCLNPEGAKAAMTQYRETEGFWNKKGRANAFDIDINRDYHALKSAEAKLSVSLFNRISPQVVLDLHEFSSKPLIVAGKGWWRAKYFDLMMGAGRHPDVYPPLAQFARTMCEEKVFPGLKAQGIRGVFYALADGSFDSSYHMAVNGADYFNLRNALTFLLETAASDEGEKNIIKRTDSHRAAIKIILDELIRNKKTIEDLVRDSRKFALERDSITLSMKTKPVEVTMGDEKVIRKYLQTEITIDGRTYQSPVHVRFRDGDLEERTTLDLPGGYVIICNDVNFIKILILHGIKVYEAQATVKSGKALIPRHSFYVPVEQESSAIIGFTLDPTAVEKNRFPLMARVQVLPVEEPLNLNNFKEIQSPDQVPQVIQRFTNFMEELLKNQSVEDSKGN